MAVGPFAGSELGEAAAIAPSLWPIAAHSLQDNGYARLLRRQVEEVFRDNRMIAVCQYNSMPDEDVVLMRHYLRKHNIEVKFVLNEVGAELPGQIPVWLGRGKVGESWDDPVARAGVKSCILRAVSPRSSDPCCHSPSTRISSLSLWRAISCW